MPDSDYVYLFFLYPLLKLAEVLGFFKINFITLSKESFGFVDISYYIFVF